MSGFALLPVIAIFVFARPIATLCFGYAAEGAIPVMRWIAPLPLLVAVTSVLGVLTMLTFGLDKQFSRILIAAGILNLVLAVPLISTFAAQGAGASVLRDGNLRYGDDGARSAAEWNPHSLVGEDSCVALRSCDAIMLLETAKGDPDCEDTWAEWDSTSAWMPVGDG